MGGALVGREAEMAVLADCLDAALRGRPRLALCQGEPGIGKTRLAAELVAVAERRGVLAVWGRTAESQSAPPYWPWWQVLRAMAGTVDLPTIAKERRLHGELARLAPDVFPPADAELRNENEPEDRFRQFDAVTRLLRQVCRHTPVVIVLDDVHWADEPTLLLLHHVARAAADERLLLIVNTRVAEQRHGDLLSRLLREPLTVPVDLRGLTAPAIRQQLASVVGHDVDDAAVAEVESLTGGNPFFVGELGRAMADGRPARRFPVVTPTVRNAIADRLGRLAPDSVQFVRAAAIVGPDFALDVVAAMVGVPAVRGLQLVGEAERAGLVEHGSVLNGYRFVHALVRDAIEAGLAPSDQAELHGRAAEAIERLYAPDLGPQLFDVARHWVEAVPHGDVHRAAVWVERAADEAMRQLAYEEGARLYRQALDVGGSALGDEARCRLLLGAGRALQLSGDLGGRLDACLDAAAAARRLGRPDMLAEAALVMEPVGDRGFDIATRRLCQEALAALGPDPTALRARVMAAFVGTFIFTLDLEAVAPASEEALDIATGSGDTRAIAAALHARRLVCAGPDGLDERERLAARMLALSREHGDARAEMRARLWQIDASFERGDFVRVANEIDALARSAQQVRGPLARFDVLAVRAVLAQAQGRFDDARRLESEAFNVLAPTGHMVRFVLRSGLLAMIGSQVGQDEKSVTANRFHDAPDGTLQGIGLIAQLSLAHMFVTADRLDEARRIYRSLGPVAAWSPPPHVILFSYAFGLVVAIALGESADVATLRDLLAPYRGHHVVSGTSAVAYFGPVELKLGIAAHHLRLLDEAVTDLEAAEAACAASGAAGFGADAQFALAEVLADRGQRGDIERARSLITAAGNSARSLGMNPLRARVARLARRLDRPAASLALTRREREVAELVAEGLTNREIAGRLYLSERTADNHVQHILTKLGMSNRSQIAVWVTSRRMSTPAE